MTDEQILQRFRSGTSTAQMANYERSPMTEADVYAALHRAQDMEWAAADRGGYHSELLESRRRRNQGDAAPASFERPQHAVARPLSER